MNFSASPIFNKFLLLVTGLVLGVIVSTTFVYFKNTERENSKETQKAILSLELDQSEKFIATSEKVFKITGKTNVASIVTINSPAKNVAIESSDGNFVSEIELFEGINQIDITAFDPNSGESQTARKEVLYLSEELSSL